MLQAVEVAVAAQKTPAASPSFDMIIETARAYIDNHMQHHVKVEEFFGTREIGGELPPELHKMLLVFTEYNEILAANWVLARTAFIRLTRGARE
jgi:hypothetical protein